MVTLGLGLGILMSISRAKKLSAKSPDRIELG
jgi:rod shape determining protein RodA